MVNAVELSGDGAIAGNNFNNGALLAFNEINAAGGILGRKIDVVTLDIETKPEVAKAALRKAAELQAFAMMGPVFSDMVLDVMEEIRQSRAPDLRRRRGGQPTAQGNPYLFRTSLSQAASMPKLARYLKDGLRVGKRGHGVGRQRLRPRRPRGDDQGAGGRGDRGRRRPDDRTGAARLHRGRGQGPRLRRQCRLRLPQRARVCRLPAGAVRRGLWRLDRRRDHAGGAERDRHGRLGRQRGARPCRADRRRAVPGIRDFANRFCRNTSTTATTTV